jgi:hypothetical protein
MTVVFEPSGPDRERLGAVSEHFIAIWGEEDSSAHAVFCVPPEWQPLADKIEAVLSDFAPIRPIWEWPEVQPE